MDTLNPPLSLADFELPELVQTPFGSLDLWGPAKTPNDSLLYEPGSDYEALVQKWVSDVLSSAQVSVGGPRGVWAPHGRRTPPDDVFPSAGARCLVRSGAPGAAVEAEGPARPGGGGTAKGLRHSPVREHGQWHVQSARSRACAGRPLHCLVSFQILSQFPGEDSVLLFEDLARGLDAREVSRTFLSCLMLVSCRRGVGARSLGLAAWRLVACLTLSFPRQANTYNVELSQTTEGDLAMDCLRLRLLTRARHHHELEKGALPSARWVRVSGSASGRKIDLRDLDSSWRWLPIDLGSRVNLLVASSWPSITRSQQPRLFLLLSDGGKSFFCDCS